MLMVTQPCSSSAAASAALTVRIRISIPRSFHYYVAFGYSLQTFDQLPPADVTIVAQHGDRRYAAAFYDHIALRHILDAAHLAHAVFQPAAQAQRGIAKSLEETQKTALDRGGRSGSAQRGNILHRGLADAARVFARAARDARIKAHRLPVDEFKRLDLGVDAAGDVAE